MQKLLCTFLKYSQNYLEESYLEWSLTLLPVTYLEWSFSKFKFFFENWTSDFHFKPLLVAHMGTSEFNFNCCCRFYVKVGQKK